MYAEISIIAAALVEPHRVHPVVVHGVRFPSLSGSTSTGFSLATSSATRLIVC